MPPHRRLPALLVALLALAMIATGFSVRPAAAATLAVPTGLKAAAQNQSVALTWAAPTTPPVGYRVEFKPSTATTWTGVDVAVPTTTLTGLTNGVAYNLRLAATYQTGLSGFVSFPTTVPRTTAGVVSKLSSTPANGGATIRWAAPANTGGTPITGYTVGYRLATDSTWTPVARPTPTALSATLTGLVNGQTYQVAVVATNSAGAGAESSIDVFPGRPAAVGVPVLVGVDGGVRATWSAPVANGSTLTGYAVQYRVGTDQTWADGPSTAATIRTATLTGLTNGDSVQVRVVAQSTFGPSEALNVGSINVGSPGAPTLLAGTSPDTTSLTLGWTAPANSASPITGFTLDYKPATSPTWTTQTVTDPSTVLDSLVAGTVYQVRVRATNSYGVGPYSATLTRTAGVPAAPTGLKATSTDGQLALFWTAPPAVAGADGVGYKVEYRLSTDTVWIGAQTTEPNITLTGLANNSLYYVRVYGTNSVGVSPVSATISAKPGLPDAPVLSAIPSSKTLNLIWSSPTPAPDGYVLRYKLSTATTWTTRTLASTATTYVLTGLTNGGTYQVSVAGKNVVGIGAYSAPIETFVDTVVTPSTPTGLTVSPTVAGAHLTWDVPTAGAATPTGYTLRWRTDAGVWDSRSVSGSSADLSGLAADTIYQVELVATNSAGASAPAVGTVQTPTVPGVVGTLVAADTDKTVTLSWSAPAFDGRTELTGYAINVYSNNVLVETFLTSNTTFTIPDLANGTTYTFEVIPANPVGVGPASTVVATPAARPSQPTSVMVADAHGQLTVSWTQPDNGGAPVLSSTVSATADGRVVKTCEVEGVGTECVLSGLTDGVDYTITVVSTNAKGLSEASTPVTASVRPKGNVAVHAPVLSLPYTSPTPELAPDVTGDSNTVTTPPTCTSTYTPASLPGAYPVVCEGAQADYANITYLSGTIFVTPLTVTVTAPTVQVPFGQTPPPLAPTADRAVDLSAITCTSSYLPGSTLGDYPVACAGTLQEGYDPVFVTGNVSVVPAPLVVNAPRLTVGVGEELPTLLPAIEGQTPAQTAAFAPIVCTSEYTSATPSGVTIPVNCTGPQTVGGYTLTYLPGTITVAAPAAVCGPPSQTVWASGVYRLTCNTTLTAPTTWSAGVTVLLGGYTLNASNLTAVGTPANPIRVRGTAGTLAGKVRAENVETSGVYLQPSAGSTIVKSVVSAGANPGVAATFNSATVADQVYFVKMSIKLYGTATFINNTVTDSTVNPTMYNGTAAKPTIRYNASAGTTVWTVGDSTDLSNFGPNIPGHITTLNLGTSQNGYGATYFGQKITSTTDLTGFTTVTLPKGDTAGYGTSGRLSISGAPKMAGVNVVAPVLNTANLFFPEDANLTGVTFTRVVPSTTAGVTVRGGNFVDSSVSVASANPALPVTLTDVDFTRTTLSADTGSVVDANRFNNATVKLLGTATFINNTVTDSTIGTLFYNGVVATPTIRYNTSLGTTMWTLGSGTDLTNFGPNNKVEGSNKSTGILVLGSKHIGFDQFGQKMNSNTDLTGFVEVHVPYGDSFYTGNTGDLNIDGSPNMAGVRVLGPGRPSYAPNVTFTNGEHKLNAIFDSVRVDFGNVTTNLNFVPFVRSAIFAATNAIVAALNVTPDDTGGTVKMYPGAKVENSHIAQPLTVYATTPVKDTLPAYLVNSTVTNTTINVAHTATLQTFGTSITHTPITVVEDASLVTLHGTNIVESPITASNGSHIRMDDGTKVIIAEGKVGVQLNDSSGFTAKGTSTNGVVFTSVCDPTQSENLVENPTSPTPVENLKQDCATIGDRRGNTAIKFGSRSNWGVGVNLFNANLNHATFDIAYTMVANVETGIDLGPLGLNEGPATILSPNSSRIHNVDFLNTETAVANGNTLWVDQFPVCVYTNYEVLYEPYFGPWGSRWKLNSGPYFASAIWSATGTMASTVIKEAKTGGGAVTEAAKSVDENKPSWLKELLTKVKDVGLGLTEGVAVDTVQNYPQEEVPSSGEGGNKLTLNVESCAVGVGNSPKIPVPVAQPYLTTPIFPREARDAAPQAANTAQGTALAEELKRWDTGRAAYPDLSATLVSPLATFALPLAEKDNPNLASHVFTRPATPTAAPRASHTLSGAVEVQLLSNPPEGLVAMMSYTDPGGVAKPLGRVDSAGAKLIDTTPVVGRTYAYQWSRATSVSITSMYSAPSPATIGAPSVPQNVHNIVVDPPTAHPDMLSVERQIHLCWYAPQFGSVTGYTIEGHDIAAVQPNPPGDTSPICGTVLSREQTYSDTVRLKIFALNKEGGIEVASEPLYVTIPVPTPFTEPVSLIP